MIIFLFLGFAFTPVIYTANSIAYKEDEFIEFPVEIYRPFKEVHKVKINRDKVKEIEQLIDSIKKQIENIKSPDEATNVFNKAVLKLHEHGLFPDDMSIEEAQQLVNGGYYNKKALHLFDKIIKRNQFDFNNYNIFCRIGGAVEYPLFVGVLGRIFYTLFALWSIMINRSLLLYFLMFPLAWIFFPLAEFQNIQPFHIGHGVYIGYKDELSERGWVNAIGLLGIRQWEGKLWGCIPIKFGPLGIWNYPAIIGFTGYKIPTDLIFLDEIFFIGFALCVGIENA